MKTSRLGGVIVALGLLGATATAQTPIGPIPEPPQGGLQVTLTTAGYKFFTTPGPLAGSTRPVLRDSFPASAIVYNRSNSDIVFTFPNALAAAKHFTFRLFDSAGHQVWSDNDTAVPGGVPAEDTEATLARRSTWRRTVQVPLFVKGQPLASDIYTLKAIVEADQQVGAISVFEVANPPNPDPDPKLTGIRGRVLKATGISPNSAGILPSEVPVAGARIFIGESVEANSPTRPPFHWEGVTNADGRFEANVPPARYRVTATLPPSLSRSSLAHPPSQTVEVTVQGGRFSEVTILFPAPQEAKLIYIVDQVEIRAAETAAESVDVKAVGTVRTGGWTNPRLRPRGLTTTGIAEFDFIATPPNGPATQALASVTATITIPKAPGFRGVRVIAETNSKEALLAP